MKSKGKFKKNACDGGHEPLERVNERAEPDLGYPGRSWRAGKRAI